jgi:hypothetical protein
MNKNQINKSRMYSSVDMVLDNNTSFFSQLEELVKAHQQLKNGQILISQYRQIQEVDSTGLTKNKIKLRKEMIGCILKFSASLRAYATSVKNDELKVKTNYGLSDLKKSADPILLDIGALMMALANTVKNELIRFFISVADFKEIDRLLFAFKLAIPKKRVAISASKVSTLNIGKVFSAQDTLLKEVIDVMMLPLRFSQPDFYNAYKNARTIVNFSGRGKAKMEAVQPG